MDDADAMCFVQNVANLHCNSHCLARRETALTSKCLRERLSLNKFHDYEVTSVGQIAGVKDHGCMRVSQLCHRPRFAQETIGDIAVGRKLRFDDLHRDGSIKAEVGGAIHRSHATGSKFVFNTKPAGDKLGDIHI